jgi:hypothetical protein
MKHFCLCFWTILVLAICFDVAVEFDDWMKLPMMQQSYRVLSMALILFPIALWVTLLSCVIRWQGNREVQLLQSYDLSLRRCCSGMYLAIGLLVLIWFGLKEGVWLPLADRQPGEQKVLLVPFEQGRAILERDEVLEISNVWIDHSSGEAQYQALIYLEGKGWRLKEDSRMNNAKLKAEFEKLFDHVYPSPLHLKLAFGDVSKMSLWSLLTLSHVQVHQYVMAVRFGLPLLAIIWMCISLNWIFFKTGKTLWFNWALSFLIFVTLVGMIQRNFSILT